jgi:acyl-coenzyme A synthetase/AMP-(fatty) acid ligase
MVFSDSQEPTADFLERASAHRATHILGTPSHWRRAIMSPSANRIAPQYVRLSGEIADQQILNQLRTCYPQARMAHAFASTEAGVVFEVNDGLAGFPETTVNNTDAGVEMKIEDGSLRVRSARVAARYLGKEHNLKDGDGFVDTRDMVELREDRYYFAGRRDGVINVGGFKVHPEEVEAVINRHPHVRMSLVRTRKNPITGAVVVADIVLDRPSDAPSEQIEQLRRELLQLCQKTLPRHKIPAAMNFVPALSLSATGKMARHNA